jgi:hypothetical protein
MGETPWVSTWALEEEAMTGRKEREKDENREGKGRKKRMEKKEKSYRGFF